MEVRRTIKKADLMERLRDCFDLVDVQTEAELSAEQVERINVNLQIARLYVDLQETRESSQVKVVGFRVGEDDVDEGDEQEEEETEDEEE